MRRLIIFSLLLLIPFLLEAQVKNIKSRKEIRAERKVKIEQSVRQIIESNKFVFVVRNANPALGPSISLTSDYDIKISKDSAHSYLPYFGVAYRANYGDSEGGIKFNTVIYNFKKEFNTKTQYYELQFEVIEAIETYKIYLNVSTSGYGNLKIISNVRQTISYDGILKILLEE